MIQVHFIKGIDKMYYKNKKAFTLIEVMVSVIIISIVVMGILKQQSLNTNMATYLLKRGDAELDNTLFLSKSIKRYHEENKTAYDVLLDEFSIKDLESREILREVSRNIHITEEIEIPIVVDEASGQEFTFFTNEILLKENYSARYYTFK